MDKVITTFRKNSTEEVRATLSEFKGRQYASVRAYVEADSGEWVPTKKGLTLPVDLLPELARAVRLLSEEVVKRGLVEEERFKGEPG